MLAIVRYKNKVEYRYIKGRKMQWMRGHSIEQVVNTQNEFKIKIGNTWVVVDQLTLTLTSIQQEDEVKNIKTSEETKDDEHEKCQPIQNLKQLEDEESKINNKYLKIAAMMNMNIEPIEEVKEEPSYHSEFNEINYYYNYIEDIVNSVTDNDIFISVLTLKNSEALTEIIDKEIEVFKNEINLFQKQTTSANKIDNSIRVKSFLTIERYQKFVELIVKLFTNESILSLKKAKMEKELISNYESLFYIYSLMIEGLSYYVENVSPLINRRLIANQFLSHLPGCKSGILAKQLTSKLGSVNLTIQMLSIILESKLDLYSFVRFAFLMESYFCKLAMSILINELGIAHLKATCVKVIKVLGKDNHYSKTQLIQCVEALQHSEHKISLSYFLMKE